jgi:signal transduction histidine kinase
MKLAKPGIVFAAAATLIVASTGLMYYIGRVALENNRRLAAQRAVLEHIERIGSTIKDAETGQRGFLLTGRAEYLQPYRTASGQIHRELATLEVLMDSERERARARQLAALTDSKLQEMQHTIRVRQETGLAAAVQEVNSDKGKQLMDNIRASLAEMQREETIQFEAAKKRTDRATQLRTTTFILTGVLNLAFLGWAFRAISTEMQSRARAQEELQKSHDELENRVRERTAELTAANKELEAFAYSVSHDLRAPLRHVSSFVKLLEKNAAAALDEKGRRYIQVISEAADRMGRLIDDLLLLSRLGRATLSEKPVNLAQLVDEARIELAPAMTNRNIEWRIQPLPEVVGDPMLLRSAIVNLLSNAIKYSRNRQPAVIEIGTERRNGEIVVFVRDNGAGFDMQFADKLFGPFQRLHRIEEFEGTGIGLASVRRVIQRHGGHTWAEGKVNQGATFYCALPRDRLYETNQANTAGGRRPE